MNEMRNLTKRQTEAHTQILGLKNSTNEMKNTIEGTHRVDKT